MNPNRSGAGESGRRYSQGLSDTRTASVGTLSAPVWRGAARRLDVAATSSHQRHVSYRHTTGIDVYAPGTLLVPSSSRSNYLDPGTRRARDTNTVVTNVSSHR